jgi:hypothetical protein
MRLFGRKKEKVEEGPNQREVADPTQGMARLVLDMTDQIEKEFCKFVAEHMERIHTPGGYQEEKKVADFMDLGMGRKYIEALDDMEISIEEGIAMPETRGRKRGRCEVVTRWAVRGVHARPLAGLPPSGSEVTIEGVTLTTFRDYRIRVEYSYWELPELNRTVLDR